MKIYNVTVTGPTGSHTCAVYEGSLAGLANSLGAGYKITAVTAAA